VVSIAVVTGDYDRIESLIGSLGLDYTLYYGDEETVGDNPDHPMHAKKLIGNLDELRKYDMVFINCGFQFQSIWWGAGNPPTTYVNNLRQFVDEGGRLYVSDWAFVSIMESWPEAIMFDLSLEPMYNCPDTVGGCVMCGYGPYSTEATIQNPNMEALVGAKTVAVTYELDGWAIIGGYSPSAQSHIVGTIQSTSGLSAAYCPNPPIEIHNSPLVVSYKPNPTAGNVVFTTFHNVEQEETLGEAMRLILKYLVFLL